MFWLSIVSLVWAFSFLLIKNWLPGLDSTACATVRLILALLVFAPMLRPRGIRLSHAALLAGIGVVQFGLMYVFYMAAFHRLTAGEVALFTVSTPFFVTIADSALKRRLPPIRWIFAATLAALAAAILLWRRADSSTLWQGVLLVQASNLCFAFGQIAYKHLRPHIPNASDASVFGWLMLGGATSTLLCSFPLGVNWNAFLHETSFSQWVVLIYLGAIASGICFFLWNRGALQVNAGTLAVFNNLKIPLGVVCAIGGTFFLQSTLPPLSQLARLSASLLLIFAALHFANSRKT